MPTDQERIEILKAQRQPIIAQYTRLMDAHYYEKVHRPSFAKEIQARMQELAREMDAYNEQIARIEERL